MDYIFERFTIENRAELWQKRDYFGASNVRHFFKDAEGNFVSIGPSRADLMIGAGRTVYVVFPKEQ